MDHSTQSGRRFPALCLLIAFVACASADDKDLLTDEEVTAILDRGSAGVFYAWSPHMPLSVDGLVEITRAGEHLGLVVVPVLSSHANIAYARDRIQQLELPVTVLRQGQSVTLVERDLFVHAPAILIFDDGKFVSPVIPGFRYAADYEALIGRFLETARQ